MKIKNLLVISAAALLAGCAGVVVANTITAVSETASAYALQQGSLTVPQLSQLAKDLPGVASGEALSPQDNAALAGVVAGLLHQKETLTGGSALDAVNNALTAINAAKSPTAAQGLVWANLMDVAAGMSAEVNFVNQNPQLAPK
jgi:hypothetical protein